MPTPSRLYAWDPEDPDYFDPENGEGSPGFYEPRDDADAERFSREQRESGMEVSEQPPPMGGQALAQARSARLADIEDTLIDEGELPAARGPSPLVTQYPEDDAPPTPPAAAPAPFSAPPPMQRQRVPWETLAQYRGSQARTEPTPVRGPNKGLLVAGSIFDALLNKGRGIGTLMGIAAQGDNIAAQNEDRRLRAEAHDANMMRALAQAEGGGDPYTQWLRAEQLKQRQIEEARRGKESEARIAAAEAERVRKAALADPNSAETQAARDSARAIYGDAVANEVGVDNMTGEQLLQWRPQLGQQAHALQQNDEWRSRFAMGQRAQLEKEGRASEAKIAEEGRGEERTAATRAEDFADKYATKYDKDLAIAGLIQEINEAGGAAPQSFAERFGGTIAARGIDPSRLEAWRAKQLVLEEWGRKQSQGAIGLQEEERLQIQTALQPSASEADVNAAYAVMQRHVKRYIRMGAVANPEAARTVAQAAGLDDSWLEGIGDANKRRAQKSGAAPAANPAEPAPAAPPKPVLSADEVSGDEWEDL